MTLYYTKEDYTTLHNVMQHYTTLYRVYKKNLNFQIQISYNIL
jgi:hypothetical protein